MPKLLIIFLFLSLSGCTQTHTVEQLSGKTMGTTYSIKSSAKVEQHLIDQHLEKINNIFSSWDQSSELSKLNRAPINQPILLSDELLEVLIQSVDVYEQTNGFFDPALDQLIDVWGFGATKVSQKPSRDMIIKALDHSSIAKASLDKDQLTKHSNIKFNLSAIAKGYAVDKVADLLAQQGVERFMVEIGGEIKVKGSWTVGVEMPLGKMPITVELTDESIATSGNYRQYFVWEGERYAHIINPKTGLPVRSDLFSVSVIHSSNMLADAYATAMMAMGSAQAQQLAKRLKLKVILVLNTISHEGSLGNVIKLGL